jgi:hypothetical protein
VKKLIATALLFAALTSGCGATAAQIKADLHSASTSALGLISLMETHPELTENAKAAVGALAQKVDPKDAPKVQQALDLVNQNNLGEAKALIAPFALASAPSPTPSPSTSPAPGQ